jgi:hypothetical protein
MNTPLSPKTRQPPDVEEKPGDSYCEICGTLICRDDLWVDERAGVCAGCERTLCGNCAEWREEGECVTCREFPYSHCHYCGAEFAEELRGGYRIAYCPWCGHEIDREDIAKDPLRKTPQTTP